MEDGLRIVFIGKMRSGKSTLADLFAGYQDLHKMSFGHRLKEYAHEIFQPEGDVKARELYQGFGQKMREIDPDVWVKQVEKDIKENGYKRIVIDDLRQPNEYKWARENGFILVKVVTSDEVRKKRMESKGELVTDEILNHETEQHIDGYQCDYTVSGEIDPLTVYLTMSKAIKFKRKGVV
ncbi:AAA family ATPase [Exiguobacterium sp. s133]|uniref:AAA family ATPase n=1 Tax=Exiguobacterium sp. s133 TaxID=2751213 RepID=UPI001BEC305D|nr:AAA family ATPase [Exiguobacterium sp. s133]